MLQTDAQENKIQEKDSEVLRLLNQIATDMIRKSDVDRLIEEAVAKATAALKADYEERMKAMAAEYEARIAEIQNHKDGKGDDKGRTTGKSTKNSRKKGGTRDLGPKIRTLTFQKIMLAELPVKSGLRSYGGLRLIFTNLQV